MSKPMHSSISRFLAAAAAAGALMLAAGSAVAAEVKVGSVRYGDLVFQSPQAKVNNDKFKAEFEKRQKDFDAEVKKFQDDVAQMRRDDGTISATEADRRKKDLATREVDLNTKGQQLQEDKQTRNAALSQEVELKVRDAIVSYAKANGYDLIVTNAVYATDSVDVTDEVLKSLGGTPGAAATPAPAKSKPKN